MTDQAIQITQIEELTRKAVQNVFKQMLAIEVNPGEPSPLEEDPLGQIIGSVGFIGEATGVIHISASATFGMIMTRKMLGLEREEIATNEMVNDVMGEITNMVVGYVKSHLCDEGLSCILSIPSVVRGQALTVEGAGQILRRVFGIRNCSHNVVVEICLKES